MYPSTSRLTRPYASPSRRRRQARGRRRLVSVVLGVIAALGVALVGFAGNVYGGDPSAVRHVTVRTGDSLWSIAERVYGTDDVRGQIDTIIRINHLDGGSISPGQDLIVPSS